MLAIHFTNIYMHEPIISSKKDRSFHASHLVCNTTISTLRISAKPKDKYVRSEFRVGDTRINSGRRTVLQSALEVLFAIAIMRTAAADGNEVIRSDRGKERSMDQRGFGLQ
jgi:hypothetical protein